MADSAYGKGFAMRMGVLVVLLALVGAGFYFDSNWQSAAQKTIDDKIWPLATKKDDKGQGVTKSEVASQFGFAPSETKKVDKYEVEKYNFKRVIPFTSGQFVEVAYENGYLHKIVVNKEFSPTAAEDLMSGVKQIPADQRTMPASSLSGGGDPGQSDDGDKKEEEKKDDGEAKADDKKEEAADAKTEDKKEEKKDDDEKKDDN